MDEYESLSHTKWECKYHVVPKCRRKLLYGELRRHLGEVFHKLTKQRESKIEEGHLMPDHVHMRDPRCANVRGAEAELRGAALLGARLLRLDRRSRRRGHPPLHPGAGDRGQAHRPAPPVELSRHLQVAPRAARERLTVRPL